MPNLAAPGEEDELAAAVLRYSREIVFAAVDVYASAAEARGAWDSRAEAGVVDALVRGNAGDLTLSRAASLGWGRSNGWRGSLRPSRPASTCRSCARAPGTEHPEIREVRGRLAERAPLGWDVKDPEPVARACVALAVGLVPGDDRDVVYVDGGFGAIGV